MKEGGTRAPLRSPSSVIRHLPFTSLVRLVEQVGDRLAGGGLPRRKRRNVSFWRLLNTMFIACRCCCGASVGAQQQEDAVDRLVVQRGEVDPAELRPIVPAICLTLRA
jgi:hypothetical protein